MALLTEKQRAKAEQLIREHGTVLPGEVIFGSWIDHEGQRYAPLIARYFAEQAKPQETFFDAVKNDPTMATRQKVEWLHSTCKDYWQRLERSNGILESFLVDHTWRARESGKGHRCDCPACLSAREILAK